MTKIFPITIIVLSLAAAAVYAINKDIRHTVYWLATATLVSAVTF